jgi:Holliday junction resolvase RusA-like endonuclease
MDVRYEECDDVNVNTIIIDMRDEMPNSVTNQLRRMGWSEEAIARATIDGKPATKAQPTPRRIMGGTIRFTIPATPIGKPRMTKRDKWKKRTCVLKYRDWADLARAVAGPLPPADTVLSLSWVATFVPAASHSKAKRDAMIGQLHRQKPDRDNIDKAVLDALYPDGDAAIPGGTLLKVWGTTAKLEIEIVCRAHCPSSITTRKES